MKKKCLIVSYYLSPPENTPRAFHTQGMIQAFEKCGYEVDIIIPENNFNYSNSNIYQVRPFFRNKPKYSMGRQRIFNNQRGNFLSRVKARVFKFIHFVLWPDITLPYAYFAYKKIKELDKNYDVLFTVTGPYSPLLVGFLAKKFKYTKIWINDYGDPLSGLEHGTGRFHDAYLEKKILSRVDYVTIPDKVAEKSYLKLVKKEKINIIPQQFRWNVEKSDYIVDSSKINLLFAGKMYTKRPPDDLVIFLKSNNSNETVLHMFGDANYFHDFMKTHSPEFEFKGRIHYNGFIDRSKLLDIFTKMDYLINIEWPTSNQKPSKLIDYKIANRKIINLPQDINLKVKKQKEFSKINDDYLEKNEKYALDFIQEISIEIEGTNAFSRQ